MAKILHNLTLYRGWGGSGEKMRGSLRNVPTILAGIAALELSSSSS